VVSAARLWDLSQDMTDTKGAWGSGT